LGVVVVYFGDSSL